MVVEDECHVETQMLEVVLRRRMTVPECVGVGGQVRTHPPDGPDASCPPEANEVGILSDVTAGGLCCSAYVCADGTSSPCRLANEPCGDPAAQAAYDQCTLATSSGECATLGGDWRDTYGHYGPQCVCPTGQGDCACDESSDCLGLCVGAQNTCGYTPYGMCTSVGPALGCRCWIEDWQVEDFYCLD